MVVVYGCQPTEGICEPIEMHPQATDTNPSELSASEEPARLAPHALWSICLALFAVATSMSCVFAILPSVGRDLGLNETQLGWVVAPAAFVFVLFGPVWGRLGERWSARSILTISLTVIAVLTLLFGYVMAWRLEEGISLLECFILLMTSRVLLSPFSAAMLPTAQSHIANTTDSAGRQRALASMGASFALGMVLSPGLAAVATSAGLLMPFFVVAALLLTAACSTWIFLPRFVHMAPHIHVAVHDSAGTRTGWLEVWRPLGILALLYTVYGILMQVTGFRMQDQFHLDSAHATQHAGGALMATAGALVAAQMVLSRLSVTALGLQRRIVLGGGLLGLIGLASLVGNPGFSIQLLAMALFGLSLGIFMPFVLNLLTLRAQGAGDQVRIGGFSGAAQGLGMAIGPLLGAWSYRIDSRIPYWIAVTSLLLVCALYAYTTAPRR